MPAVNGAPGSIVLSEAGSCAVREFDLPTGLELPNVVASSTCDLWAAPVTAKVAVGIERAGRRRDPVPVRRPQRPGTRPRQLRGGVRLHHLEPRRPARRLVQRPARGHRPRVGRAHAVGSTIARRLTRRPARSPTRRGTASLPRGPGAGAGVGPDHERPLRRGRLGRRHRRGPADRALRRGAVGPTPSTSRSASKAAPRCSRRTTAPPPSAPATASGSSTWGAPRSAPPGRSSRATCSTGRRTATGSSSAGRRRRPSTTWSARRTVRRVADRLRRDRLAP